jgi:4-hydroxy-tetrahydrodipicolinate synthase
MFQGSMVALVTPMQADGSIDTKAVHELVEWHIDAKTTAIIVAGSTGEAATLSHAEQEDLIKRVVKQVAGRLPVIAGTGTYCTRSTVERTKAAEAAGADAMLVVTPYYNKPTQNGLYEHYKAVAECTTKPVILYNVPGRTACDLLPETVERLSKIPNIVGIKEATGKIDRCIEILQRCDNDFEIYSGDDATGLELLLNGGHGVISVTANAAPRKMQRMCEAAKAGNKALAEKINAELMPLHTTLFVEANPIPVKWVMHEMGLIPPGIRMPLMPLDAKYHPELRTALHQAGAMETINQL